MKCSVTGICMAQDCTIVSYNISKDVCVTTSHRRYMSKVRNSDEETESTEDTGTGDQDGSQQSLKQRNDQLHSRCQTKEVFMTIYSILCMASLVLNFYLQTTK